MKRHTCGTCGHVHSPTDARAIGRFDPDLTTTYVAAHAQEPPRATRAEAETDECAWRATNRTEQRA